jgi:hypothetical protein
VYVVREADDPLSYAERDSIAGDPDRVGTTPSAAPLEIPSGVTWFVAPADTRISGRAAAAIVQEVADRGVPGVSFQGCAGVGDALMPVLATVKELRYLDLRGTSVSARGLGALRGHPRLTWLDAADRQPEDLTWAGKLPALRVLDVSGAWLTSGGLEGPGHSKKLESLTIRRSSEFGEGALYPLRGATALRHLFAGENDDLRDAELTRLAAVRSLVHLELARTGITDAGLAALAKCSKLESLDLSECAVDGSGLAALAGARRLRRIVLRQTRVGDSAGAALAGLKSLRAVSVEDTPFGDAGVASLAGHGALEELDLTDCVDVTEASLPVLRKMKSLRVLSIRGTSIPRSAVRELTRALPRCDVR